MVRAQALLLQTFPYLLALAQLSCRTPIEVGCGNEYACRAARLAAESNQAEGASSKPPPTPPPAVSRVRTAILISVDGLAVRFIDALRAQGELPTFARLQSEGAYTHNARTEARISVTLPNHISMVTGRPAVAVPGAPVDTNHGYVDNTDPGDGFVLHKVNPNLNYLRSAFDAVHDAGGYTSLFAGKSKFMLFRRSYSPPASAADLIAPDNGLDKIDDFDVITDTPTLVTEFLEELAASSSENHGPRFAMLHIRDTDATGHSYGWGSVEYLNALRLADEQIGRVLRAVVQRPALADAVVLVTTDHGGVDYGHYEPQRLEIGAIPFYLWGSIIPAGKDLYELTAGTRTDPGCEFPMDEAPDQPLRNGDAANVLLPLLGLDELEGALHRGVRLKIGPSASLDAGPMAPPPDAAARPSDAAAPVPDVAPRASDAATPASDAASNDR